jgi:hypothetical protein
MVPLYNEEIHVPGRREITDFDGLPTGGGDRPGRQRDDTTRLLFKTSRSHRRRWSPSTPTKPWPS